MAKVAIGNASLVMVEHSIPALEVVLVFITIYLHMFLLKHVRSCARGILTSDRHIDLLLSTKAAFLEYLKHRTPKLVLEKNYLHF